MQPAFDVGDRAYYPVHGVAQVVGLEQRDIGGSRANVYILEILESGLKIMVPAANTGTVGLREIISRDEVEEVYDILRAQEINRDTQTWNRRYREYMDKIKTGSAFEIAEVLRDLSVLRNSKDLSFGERRMLDTARGLLVKEMAIAAESTEAEIEQEIDKIFMPAAA
jgi:CarD family transcriptional regulator